MNKENLEKWSKSSFGLKATQIFSFYFARFNFQNSRKKKKKSHTNHESEKRKFAQKKKKQSQVAILLKRLMDKIIKIDGTFEHRLLHVLWFSSLFPPLSSFLFPPPPIPLSLIRINIHREKGGGNIFHF